MKLRSSLKVLEIFKERFERISGVIAAKNTGFIHEHITNEGSEIRETIIRCIPELIPD